MQIIRRLLEVAGRHPSHQTEEYRRALVGVHEALDRLAAVEPTVEKDAGPPLDRGTPKPAMKSSVTRAVAPSHERARAAALAKQTADLLGVYQPVRFWRNTARTWGIKSLGSGSAPEGPWKDVRVGIKPLRDTVLRLGREPVVMEGPYRWPVQRVQAQSIFESLLTDLRAYALAAGWSEVEMFGYLTRGKAPKPAPITVRTVQSAWGEDAIPGAKCIVIMAQAHVSRGTVGSAFTGALKRGRGRLVEANTDALVKFVNEKIRAAGFRPPWSRDMDLPWSGLLKQWIAAGHRRFLHEHSMRRRYVRAVERRGTSRRAGGSRRASPAHR